MASRDELQTLKRGLKALAILNREGPSNVALLARRLEVPRANAHRIVNTLIAEGYCRKVPNSYLYVADAQKSDMTANASLVGSITSCAIDPIERLSAAIKWPLALSTAQGPGMVSRLATHLSSPLALAKIAPGHVQPMLEASTGVVHLAMIDEQTREAALAQIARAHPAAFAEWQPRFARVFASVREEGFFIMRRAGPEASLGVPVIFDGQPAAGVAMRYMRSCISRSTAVESYLPRLRQVAGEIETALAATLHRRSLAGSGRLAPSPQPPRRAAVAGDAVSAI